MAGLAETVADLARYRRSSNGPRAAERTAGRLSETASFGDNPGELRMLSYAPPGLRSGAPLVVVLHGCTQTAEGYAEGAGWLDLADRHGLMLLCPEQKAANNYNLCFDWFQPEDTQRGSGEAASIRQMIQHVAAEHAVDPARVFVTGLSAGGAMTAVMLATYPEVFAGGAVVAGLAYGAANTVQEAFAAMFQGRSRPARAWGDLVRAASPHQGAWPKLAIWQGDGDTTVRPGAADELVKQWTDVWGLSAEPSRHSSQGGVRRSVWSSVDGVDVLQLNRVAGLGHGAPIASTGPDACGRAGPYLLEAGVSSSVEILRFWGLAQATAQAHPQVEPPPRTRSPAQSPRPNANLLTPDRLSQGVEKAIARAFKAAGLIR